MNAHLTHKHYLLSFPYVFRNHLRHGRFSQDERNGQCKDSMLVFARTTDSTIYLLSIIFPITITFVSAQ